METRRRKSVLDDEATKIELFDPSGGEFAYSSPFMQQKLMN